MDSITHTDSLSEMAAIVKTDDPKVLALAARLKAMDADSRAELNGIAKAYIAKQRRECEERVAGDVLVSQICEALFLNEMLANGGRAIPHDRYKIELTYTKTTDKRIDVLRQLDGKVPADELAPALYLSNPQPEWKAHAGKLQALVRKYGPESEIGKIIAEGLVDSYGPPRLVFEERAPIANVTPVEVA